MTNLLRKKPRSWAVFVFAALVAGGAACSSDPKATSCAAILPVAAGAADAGVCIPENATCASGGGAGIGDLCKGRNQTCAPNATSSGARCGACLPGFALDGTECTTQRTCESLGCAAQGRACNAESAGVHAICGACLAGATDVAGHCAQTTCGPPQGTASLTSACSVLHRTCVTSDSGAACGPCLPGWQESSGSCVAAATCASLGCDSLHRACSLLATGGATCGTCQPGFVSSGAMCVADGAATCAVARVDGGADAGPAPTDAALAGSIAASCAALHRACAAAAGGASCGPCVDGYVLDPASGACLEKKACAELTCDTQHEACVETPTGHCAGCADGFLADATTGACRVPTACLDAKAAPQGLTCPMGQECVPATSSSDAYCRPGCGAGELWNGRQCAPCPRCDGDGEDGAWSSATAAGQCICKTKTGYFYSVAGAMGAFKCDADGDGWTREGARSALESPDPSLRLNARCALRTIDRFVYENEAGQSKAAMLPAALELYETDRNDDDVILEAEWAEGSLPGDRGTSPVGAAELNRLTKLCRSPSADYDDDGAPDVFQFGGQTPAATLRPEQSAFEANAYFSELYWGEYVAGATAAGPGRYVIHEKSRRTDTTIPSAQRVQLGYGAKDDPSWRTCALQRDASWNRVSAPIGMDFATISDPADSTFAGLNLESQFKCLVVDPDPSVDHLNAMPVSALTAGNYRLQACDLTATATPAASNPALTDFACATVDAKVVQPGDVLWGAVPYLPNGPLASDPPYQRGCVSGCVAHLAQCQAMTKPSPSGVPVPAYCTTVPNTFGVFAQCNAGEICDGVDNNLNGPIDEPASLVDVGGACTPDSPLPLSGACAQSQWACLGGHKVCPPSPVSHTEVCNGVDDDCDGLVDDVRYTNPFNPFDHTYVPPCDTGLLGACKQGVLSCNHGVQQCTPIQQPKAEVCGNGVDEDCDGVLDNAPPLAPGEDCPRDRTYYKDEDGDGWPTSETKCLCHAEAPYVLPYSSLFSNNSTKIDQHGNLLTDCCDKDANTFPGATFQGDRDQCFSYDRDCDGIITPRYVASDSGCSSNAFSTSCGDPSGTYQYTTYACGATGPINTSCTGAPGCHRQFVQAQQQCK